MNVCMHEQGCIHCIGIRDWVTPLVVHFACFGLTQTRSIATQLCVTSCSACKWYLMVKQAIIHIYTLDPMQQSIKATTCIGAISVISVKFARNRLFHCFKNKRSKKKHLQFFPNWRFWYRTSDFEILLVHNILQAPRNSGRDNAVRIIVV